MGSNEKVILLYQNFIPEWFKSPQTLVNTGVSAIHSTIPTLRVLNDTITYTVNNSDNIFYYLNIFG